MSDAPTYDEMTGRGSAAGWGVRLLKSLEVGEPTLCEPGKFGAHSTNLVSIRGALSKAARYAGIPITTRVIDGVLWVVRLKPEDAKP